MNPLIAAHQTTFLRAGRSVLSSVDLHLQSSELLAIVGPNGAGKSTLLGLLAGDCAPSTGTVLHDGHPVSSMSPTRRARFRAVMGQHMAAPPGLMAFDVVLLGRLPWGGSTATRSNRVLAREALARVGALELATRPIASLSGGERQRVHLARALAQAAGASRFALLLDEPTASLDLGHADRALALLDAPRAHGAGVVAVIHDLALAARHADRIALLGKGQLVAVGAPRDVLTSEYLEVAYGCAIEVVDRGPRGLIIQPLPPRAGVSA
jgi:iron complex transport system ATP-binding protein